MLDLGLNPAYKGSLGQGGLVVGAKLEMLADKPLKEVGSQRSERQMGLVWLSDLQSTIARTFKPGPLGAQAQVQVDGHLGHSLGNPWGFCLIFILFLLLFFPTVDFMGCGAGTPQVPSGLCYSLSFYLFLGKGALGLFPH